MNDQLRFKAMLPFFVNGTLNEAERQWMVRYLEANPDAASEWQATQALRQAIQSQGTERAADAGLDRLLAEVRGSRDRPSYLTRWLAAVQAKLFGLSWRLPRPLVVAMATLLLIQGGVIGVFLHNDVPDDSDRYRGKVVSKIAEPPALTVMFSPTATTGAMAELLRNAHAHIVAGPGENGEFWLAVPKTQRIEETVALLRASAAVDDVLILDVTQGNK